MQMTFLGTASGMPVLHRSHSSILLRENGTSILLDAGEGVSTALLRCGIDHGTIEKIFISHTHPDHVNGIPMLLLLMYLSERTKPLKIFLPEDRCDWLERMLHGMFIYPEKWKFPYSILPLPLSGDKISRDVEVKFFRTAHVEKLRPYASKYGFSAQSYGFIVSDSKNRIVISSDIDSLNDVADVCQTACTLIVEGTHVSLRQIFEFTKAHPDVRVFVTHIPPVSEAELPQWKERAANDFPGRLLFADDGLQLDFTR